MRAICKDRLFRFLEPLFSYGLLGIEHGALDLFQLFDCLLLLRPPRAVLDRLFFILLDIDESLKVVESLRGVIHLEVVNCHSIPLDRG